MRKNRKVGGCDFLLSVYIFLKINIFKEYYEKIAQINFTNFDSWRCD